MKNSYRGGVFSHCILFWPFRDDIIVSQIDVQSQHIYQMVSLAQNSTLERNFVRILSQSYFASFLSMQVVISVVSVHVPGENQCCIHDSVGVYSDPFTTTYVLKVVLLVYCRQGNRQEVVNGPSTIKLNTRISWSLGLLAGLILSSYHRQFVKESKIIG